MFRKNAEFHNNSLRNTPCDVTDLNDIGEYADEHPEMWAVLLDKSYQRAFEIVGVSIRRCKPHLGVLPMKDQRRSTGIARNRITVENFIWHYYALRALTEAKYR